MTVVSDADALAKLTASGEDKISGQDVRDAYATLRGLAGTQLQQTASFTLSLSHLGRLVLCNHAATPIVVTVPTNAVVAFPLDTVLNFAQWGAAAVTFVGGGGSPATVTVRHPSDQIAEMRGQYGVASLWKVDTDEWLLFGSLSSAA